MNNTSKQGIAKKYIPERIRALRRAMNVRGYSVIVITAPAHIRYLTGFSGSAGVMILTDKHVHLFTDGRYAEQVKHETAHIRGAVIHIERDVWNAVRDKEILQSAETIAFDASRMSVAGFEAMRGALTTGKKTSVADSLKKKGVAKAVSGQKTGQKSSKHAPTFVSYGNLVSDIVMQKTPEEVQAIHEAADIADGVFAYILGWIQPGMKERDVAAEISYQARKRGSEGDAFDIIVASGVRGALPHGRASEKKIKKGELITLDFGCRVRGFHSDLTRTFAIGKPSAEARTVYNVVKTAQEAAVEAVQAGMRLRTLDAIARDIITHAGYGQYFEHGLGHGLGIEVHERPSVSHRAGEDELLSEGAVITIEPGIYLPEICGVRIEDDVWVTRTGAHVLTSSPKELIVL